MMKDAVKLMKLICDVLNRLSEEEISALLENRARLKVEFPARNESVGEVCEGVSIGVQLPDSFFQELDSLVSREEAQELFKQSNFRKVQLREIARHYSIPAAARDSNAQIIDRIVESVVGSKLKHETLLTAKLHRSE